MRHEGGDTGPELRTVIGFRRIAAAADDLPLLKTPIAIDNGSIAAVPGAPVAIAFGRFLVLPDRRELFADGEPIKLGWRAFDLLITLIEARGAVVSKGALMERVWHGRIVEENAVQAQMVALRRALGADRNLIRTVFGRGYQFTGEVHILPLSPSGAAGSSKATAGAPSGLPATNLPEPISGLIGRDAEVEEVTGLIGAHRLVTLTGTGGIGKTRLALAAARSLMPGFAEGVWLVEFSPLSDPALVPATVAAAVRLELGGGEVSVQRVAQMLAGRRLLLVLDTCEHVIETAAALAEAVQRAAPAVRIIATSREPLRVEEEWIYRVPPLALPAENARDDPLQYGAVRLFIDRVRASALCLAPDQCNASIVAICRRLDGIPLAIELVAPRAAALGVEELAARLDDRFHLLTGGRRTSLARQQTLLATLDWSYELLSEPERVLLRRLAVFAPAFALEAVIAVVTGPQLSAAAVVDGISGLIAKSLVQADVGDAVAHYRLLDTTRAYALEKLDESGEVQALARRHAEYYCCDFERAEAEWKTRRTTEWLTDYRWKIDNVRGALDWAFSAKGDLLVGVALTVAAVPLWMQLSLLEECRGRVERALVALDVSCNRDARCAMKLHFALGASLLFTNATIPESGAALTRARDIAQSLNDTEYLMQALMGLFAFHLYRSQSGVALTLAERFSALAADRPDPTDRLTGERLQGVSQHLLGNQVTAQRHFERMLADRATLDRRSNIVPFQIDLEVLASVFRAWTLWLQGFPDQAMRAAGSSLEDACAADHAFSHCYALARVAYPLALLVGDLAAAEHHSEMLLDLSIRHAMAHWRAIARCQQGVLAIMHGDVATGLPLLRSTMNERAASPSLRLMTILMAEALGRAGQIVDGLEAIGAAIAFTERSEDRWAIAELLRIKGELLLLQGASNAAAEAEDCFRRALDWSGRQGALSWELRAATSLARLLRDRGRSVDGSALLQPVYDRFTEGFDTADLKLATAILDNPP